MRAFRLIDTACGIDVAQSAQQLEQGVAELSSASRDILPSQQLRVARVLHDQHIVLRGQTEWEPQAVSAAALALQVLQPELGSLCTQRETLLYAEVTQSPTPKF